MGVRQNVHADAGDNKVRDAPNNRRVLPRLRAPAMLARFHSAKIPPFSWPFQPERVV